jgi:hypothetical protein
MRSKKAGETKRSPYPFYVLGDVDFLNKLRFFYASGDKEGVLKVNKRELKNKKEPK